MPAVAAGSRLASRERLSLEDLAGRTVPEFGDRGDGQWIRAICPDRTPGGRLIHHGCHHRPGMCRLDDSGPDADPAVITGYKATPNRPDPEV
ncbi:hypothetical protein ABR737_38630 [Streptomyces sp. Edi2]|uniref:hypothetical protein n=1 Tax=Streptomyces sp. Edi2 TaxID=3162528 RepID=UPI003305E6FD